MTKGVHKPYQHAKTKYVCVSNGEERNGGQKARSAAGDPTCLREHSPALGCTIA